MFSYDQHLADLVFNYCRQRLCLDPVPLDYEGDAEILNVAIEGLVNQDGTDPQEVLRVYEEVLAPSIISCDSPRFLAFIPAAPTKASLLFDMVISASSLQGASWLEASGAVVAENQVLSLLCDLAGLPKGAGGVFVSGGSAANLSSLVVAREIGRKRLGLSTSDKVQIAVSTEAHSSISNALKIMDTKALVVEVDDHRLDGRALSHALAANDQEPVVAVVATGGTTNAGIVDDLDSVGQVAKANDLWFHVDAAYGGASLFTQRGRTLLKGISQVDSFIADPHKWLFAPFDCAALLYREPRLAKAVHTQHASYLDSIHDDSEEPWNPSDYAYHLTRRARGLAIWFSLAVNGISRYETAVDKAIDLAQIAAVEISERPYLELIRQPTLSVVLFKRHGWEPSDYDAWSHRLLVDQIGFVLPSKWEGETVARFAFLHPETTPEIVREILDTMEAEDPT